MKVCLVSLTASHYRKQIYSLMEEQLDCAFIFGDGDTTVKQLDISLFKNSKRIPLLPIGGGYWYRMPKVYKLTRNYDVIIDDMGILCISSWVNLLIAKIRHQKVYLWSHGWYGREGFLKKWMKRVYSSLSAGMLVYGRYAKELMAYNGFDSSKLFVIHNSLDYDHQKKIRDTINDSDVYSQYFGNKKPVLLFIGRLTKVKRLDLLIEALNILKKKNLLYNLVFVGDGEMLSSLKDMASRYNINKQIWFYGACYDEKKNAELIYNADVCVAPGNIGLTAMHAMMFGCPCISHNDFPRQMPEFEAIQEGVTGTFFERDNVNSLADTINRWFTEKKFRREEVRKACYKEIDENWNPHKQLKIIKRVIESN